ncbi:MAG: dCTP deaminase, partial [Thermoprotei archaeon]
ARLKPMKRVFDTTGNPDNSYFFKVETTDEFVLGADEKVLVTTMEEVSLPHDLMAFVQLRSSFARTGMLIPPTIIDAGFQGNITLEVRGTSFPVRLRSGQRFAHIVFAKLTTPLQKAYSGKYQGQRGVTLPVFGEREKTNYGRTRRKRGSGD